MIIKFIIKKIYRRSTSLFEVFHLLLKRCLFHVCVLCWRCLRKHLRLNSGRFPFHGDRLCKILLNKRRCLRILVFLFHVSFRYSNLLNILLQRWNNSGRSHWFNHRWSSLNIFLLTDNGRLPIRFWFLVPFLLNSYLRFYIWFWRSCCRDLLFLFLRIRHRILLSDWCTLLVLLIFVLIIDFLLF